MLNRLVLTAQAGPYGFVLFNRLLTSDLCQDQLYILPFQCIFIVLAE